MMRSMFSGVAGLRAHQTMMDVVGNNIANVNTAGYKASEVTFQEALTQVMRGPGVKVNPLQLGDVTTGGRPGSGNPERQQAVWGQPSAPARARSRAAGLRI